MQNILDKIEALERELKALQPLKAEYQRAFDEKIRLEFNYNSNHIEGNTLTYGETRALILKDIAPSASTHTLRELEEMKAHDVAYKLMQEYAVDQEKEFTETDLKFLHHVLLVRPYWGDAINSLGQPTRRLLEVGDYKKFPNHVRLQNGEIFRYAEPFETPAMMTELLAWFYEEDTKNETHPVALAALLHYKFVRIHPFDDGNGRMARLIMNYVLLKHDLPPVIIKSKDKPNYLLALQQADADNIDAFVKYIAEQLVWSLELNIEAAKGESVEEPEDYEKQFAIWKKNELSKKEPALPKSNDLVYKLYQHGGLGDLIIAFYNKFKQIEDLFFNSSNWLGINELPFISLELFDNNVKELATANQVFQEIKVQLHLQEYKHNPKNPFNIYPALEIVFAKYSYLINFQGETLLQKGYRETITEDEINNLVQHCAKTIFEEIKTQAAK